MKLTQYSWMLALPSLLACSADQVEPPAPVAISAQARAQAEAFTGILTSVCLDNITDLVQLKTRLKAIPELPHDTAQVFLNGQAGSAWPVPEKSGSFVVTLPLSEDSCSVFGQRASAQVAEAEFLALVNQPPSPFVSRPISDTHQQTDANGDTHTLSYSWILEDSRRQLVFTLTTTQYADAQLQVLGSIAVISE